MCSFSVESLPNIGKKPECPKKMVVRRTWGLDKNFEASKKVKVMIDEMN